MTWLQSIKELNGTLSLLSVEDHGGQAVDPDSAFLFWRDQTVQIREHRKTLYFVGNGASASMASHTAADLAKNAAIHTEVFSDLSLITAIANDLSYEKVFSEPLKHRMKQGDMLVVISSSGQSLNAVHAAREAAKLGGSVFTLSAMKNNNTLRTTGTLNFYIPADSYGMAETCHAAILHHWVDRILDVTYGQIQNRQS